MCCKSDAESDKSRNKMRDQKHAPIHEVLKFKSLPTKLLSCSPKQSPQVLRSAQSHHGVYNKVEFTSPPTGLTKNPKDRLQQS